MTQFSIIIRQGEDYDQDLTDRLTERSSVLIMETDMTEQKTSSEKTEQKTEDPEIFEVLYNDSDSWSELTEGQVRQRLTGHYIDLDLIIETLRDGQTVLSSFAVYRLKRDSESI